MTSRLTLRLKYKVYHLLQIRGDNDTCDDAKVVIGSDDMSDDTVVLHYKRMGLHYGQSSLGGL